MAPSMGIAGAGLIGRVLAHYFSQVGWRVALFDRDRQDGMQSCAFAGAGMLAPFAELEKAPSVIATLGARSLDLWPEILAQVAAPVFFQREGSLVVAHGQDAPDFERFRGHVGEKLSDPSQMRSLDSRALSGIEPGLGGRFARAIFFPNEGQLEPRELLPALAQTLLARGVDWHAETEVVALEPHRLTTRDQSIGFDVVVDARGLGARPDLPALRGVRGELIRVCAPEVNLKRPIRLIHPRYPLYIVPRPEQHYLIGATSIESDDMGPLTVHSSLELLSAAYSLHPGFGEAAIVGSSVHCRPAFPDNLPRLSYSPGLVRLNGLYRHGFLVAPALAEAVVDLILNPSQTLIYPQITEVVPHVEAYS